MAKTQASSHALRALSLLTIVDRVEDYEILERSVAGQHRAKNLISSPSASAKEEAVSTA